MMIENIELFSIDIVDRFENSGNSSFYIYIYFNVYMHNCPVIIETTREYAFHIYFDYSMNTGKNVQCRTPQNTDGFVNNMISKGVIL